MDRVNDPFLAGGDEVGEAHDLFLCVGAVALPLLRTIVDRQHNQWHRRQDYKADDAAAEARAESGGEFWRARFGRGAFGFA